MASNDPQVSCNECVPSTDHAGNRVLRTALLACMRSRYTAAVIIAFAISYAFHVVEQRTDEKIQQQADLTHCVVVDTAYQQRLVGVEGRVDLHKVLSGCEHKVYDKTD